MQSEQMPVTRKKNSLAEYKAEQEISYESDVITN